MGEVSYSKSVGVGCRVVDWAPARRREIARMTSFILKAVDPSVETSRLVRCCRHEGGRFFSIRISRRSEGEGMRVVGPWMGGLRQDQPAGAGREYPTRMRGREKSGYFFADQQRLGGGTSKCSEGRELGEGVTLELKNVGG